RSVNCASTCSWLVGSGASTRSFGLLLLFSAVFELFGSRTATRGCSRERINRGARISAIAEIATMPSMNAPAMPTTHGHTRRRGLAAAVPGGTYALGGL